MASRDGYQLPALGGATFAYSFPVSVWPGFHIKGPAERYADGLEDADTQAAYDEGFADGEAAHASDYANGYAAGYAAALAFFLTSPVASEIEVPDQPDAIDHVAAGLARLASQFGDDL